MRRLFLSCYWRPRSRRHLRMVNPAGKPSFVFRDAGDARTLPESRRHSRPRRLGRYRRLRLPGSVRQLLHDQGSKARCCSPTRRASSRSIHKNFFAQWCGSRFFVDHNNGRLDLYSSTRDQEQKEFARSQFLFRNDGNASSPMSPGFGHAVAALRRAWFVSPDADGDGLLDLIV